ncbi:hypothetical protein AWC29_20885 [Mycobacterium triplex]|uniref:Uncharacterized protein n=1 Tax=Mycobacterium triplex TaxID=47839 RepID=A0A024JY39_9MYCO|nr:DUF6065 family protein [Mycobacterium triplex]ORX02297.1 hypothetical protein AWC29_20885 [Mycobacterium triplex]CDO88242.1 hypothetical protein BN973_02606 [Mycobacterium triplex]
MSDTSDGPPRPLIGFTTRDNAPPIAPAPINRAWMPEMAKARTGWPTRCLPMLIANQSGWELLNPCGFTATWMGQDGVDVMVTPHRRDTGQLLPASHFGNGILTWHLPLLLRTPPGYNLLVRGPANYPKDAVCALEGIVETDWASASFSMSWKFTRKLIPVRFEVDEPICMIVPQRRGELEEFAPEIRPITADEELQRKHDYFLRSRSSRARQLEQLARIEAGEQVQWQGHYTRGSHTDGAAGAPDHQTRRHLRPFVQPQRARRHEASRDLRAQRR